MVDKMHIPRTAQDGWFEFQNLAPGQKLVVVYPLLPGYAFAYAYPVLTHEADFQSLDFPLPRAATVTGTVVDDAGQPLAGVSVTLIFTDPEIQRFVLAGGEALREVQSNQAGFFAFEQNIKAGMSFRLEARQSGFLPSYSQPLLLQPGERRDGLVLQRGEKGFRLVVTILDSQARPIAGASVVLRSRLPVPKELALSSAHIVPVSGFTDDQGRVEFTGLAPGPWIILAFDSPTPGPGSRRLRKDIEISASTSTNELHVTLRPE
ncbi:MAG: hypothetical protein ACE5G6_01795 [Terriglobia bacterium]